MAESTSVAIDSLSETNYLPGLEDIIIADHASVVTVQHDNCSALEKSAKVGEGVEDYRRLHASTGPRRCENCLMLA